MTEQRERAAPHVLVGVVVASAALVTFLISAEAVSIFIGVVLLAAYGELRRIFAPSGRRPTLVVGGAGVGSFLWVGYDGGLERMAWIGAALALVLLTVWVVMHEITGRPHGATDDIGATLAASGLVGVLGAHVLLVRSTSFGFTGMLAIGLMVFLNDAFAFFGGRVFGRRRMAQHVSPSKTWEGAFCGAVASIGTGLVIGFTAPPFDVRSGVAFGAAVGVLAPIGDLLFSALKRSAGLKQSGKVFGPMGGALDTVDSLLFTAPFFYWAYRTIAL